MSQLNNNFEKNSKHKDKQRCPECDGVLLEETYFSPIIIKGESKDIEKKRLVCSKCGNYEREIESKTRRRDNYTKVELVEKEPERKYRPKRK
jgi:ribosomal protein S27AE